MNSDRVELATVPDATRDAWRLLLRRTLEGRMSDGYRAHCAMLTADALERSAYEQVYGAPCDGSDGGDGDDGGHGGDGGHGARVATYGRRVVLSVEMPDVHATAAAAAYCALLHRTTWGLRQHVVDAGAQEGLPTTAAAASAWLSRDDTEVLRGTAHEAYEDRHRAGEAAARSLLEDRLGAAAPTAGIFACPRCKSFDVDIEQRQTRSADEPMDCFCECKQCGKRFRRR